MANEPKMELWGCGFNAHGQVRSLPLDAESSLSPQYRAETDIFEFRKITEGGIINAIYAGWSQSVFHVDQKLVSIGSPLCAVGDEPNIAAESSSEGAKRTCGETGAPIPQINTLPKYLTPLSGFGTDSHGLQGFVNFSTTAVWKIKSMATGGAEGANKTVTQRKPPFCSTTVCGFIAVATSSSGSTSAVYCPDGPTFKIRVFDSLERFLQHIPEKRSIDASTWSTEQLAPGSNRPVCTYRVPGYPLQLVANASCFVLLTADGNVWTWGDERFPQALGRLGDAKKPGLVDGIAGCKIVKVAAGGWMAGCVSEAGEAWIWGSCAPGSEGGSQTGVGDAASDPRGGIMPLVELKRGEIARLELPLRSVEQTGSMEDDEEEDIVDIAIGDAHVLALDKQGIVWCCGRNAEGQLGILQGEEWRNAKFEKNWVKVKVFDEWELRDWKVTGVACGNLTSFAILEKEEDLPV